MKICPQSVRLTALREGWLEEEEARRLREHLEECDICSHTFRELEVVAGLLAAESGPVKPPPGGYEELLRTTILMRDRISRMPVRTPSRWRRGAAIAAAVLLIGVTAISLLDSKSTSTSPLAEISGEDAVLDYLIEEHALASDTIGFSNSASLMVMASRERR